MISWSSHFEVLRAGKVWLMMMGLGGGFPIQVSSKREEPSYTLSVVKTHSFLSPDNSEGKESIKKEKIPRPSNC